MPYPNEESLPVIDIQYPNYAGYLLNDTNSIYLDPSQITGSFPYKIGNIYQKSNDQDYEPLLDLEDQLKNVGGSISAYLSNVNEIYSCATGFCSRLNASNVPRSIFHAQYDALNSRNSFPRAGTVSNAESKTGSTSLNALSSIKDYYSDENINFYNFVAINGPFGGTSEVSKLKIKSSNSPAVRNVRINTYSPYSNSAIIDFTNLTSYLNSFTVF
jgi:hypothetical protein